MDMFRWGGGGLGSWLTVGVGAGVALTALISNPRGEGAPSHGIPYALQGPEASWAPASDATATLPVDPRVEELVEEVSAERLEYLVDRLASFETRHTLSSVDDPDRGIGAAREWMMEELRGYSTRLEVELDCYRVPAQGRITREAEICNVKAVLPGRSDRRVYVSGHYDTVAGVEEGMEDEWPQYDNPAPGANKEKTHLC